jgi:hypothetical protein
VSTVDVFDIDRGAWKVINYINEPDNLRLLYPGTFQSTGKKIVIFGGLKPVNDGESDGRKTAIEEGQKVTITNETLYFNVSTGEIKRGEDLGRPSYYLSGGDVFPQNGKINAFGFTTIKEGNVASGIMGLAAESSGSSI